MPERYQIIEYEVSKAELIALISFVLPNFNGVNFEDIIQHPRDTSKIIIRMKRLLN